MFYIYRLLSGTSALTTVLCLCFQDYSVSELIYYERPDIEGPKLSIYSKCNVPHGADLLNVLSMSLGIRGLVKKTRHLYIHEHTRIHIDDVEGLGKFIELEVWYRFQI